MATSHQAPTLIGCKLLKIRSVTAATEALHLAVPQPAAPLSSPPLQQTALAAEKRDYEAVFFACQVSAGFAFQNPGSTVAPTRTPPNPHHLTAPPHPSARPPPPACAAGTEAPKQQLASSEALNYNNVCFTLSSGSDLRLSVGAFASHTCNPPARHPGQPPKPPIWTPGLTAPAPVCFPASTPEKTEVLSKHTGQIG